MFTGIIRHLGAVAAARTAAAGKRLTIDLGPLAEGLGLGDSVAVNGACLTAAAIRGALAEFDVVAETLARTTLGELRAGSKVNLERAVRAADALDGHIVQGHVDGLARLRSIHRDGQSMLEFDAPLELTSQMVPKGSVAIDGVSLTLVDAADGRFSVALIPATLVQTTLGELKTGHKVNVETDIIGKYVQKCLRQIGGAVAGGVTMDKLRRAGFLVDSNGEG